MKNPEAYLESLIDLLDTSNNNQEVASNVFKNKLDMQEKYMGLVPDTLLDFIVNQFKPGMTYEEGDILFKKYSTFSQGGSVDFKVIGKPGGRVEPGIKYYGDNIVTPIKQGEHAGEYHLRLSGGDREVFYGSKQELEKVLNDYKLNVRQRTDIDTGLVKKLVEDANKGDKFKLTADISDEYNKIKGTNIKLSGKTKDSPVYDILSTLESQDEKINKVFDSLSTSDQPVNFSFYESLPKDKRGETVANPWRSEIAGRTGIEQAKIKRVLNKNPGYLTNKIFFDYISRSKLGISELKDLPLNFQIEYAKEAVKGRPRFTGLEGQTNLTRDPNYKIMEFAKREWNGNQGQGQIKFFDKNGKLIEWKYGTTLPYKDVNFSYKGKKFGLNNLKQPGFSKKFFPEVVAKQEAINNLLVEEVYNPIQEKTTSFKQLANDVQVKGYEWKKRAGVIDILHGEKGVTEEPFTNLRYNSRDINLLENGLYSSFKAGKISEANYKLALNNLNKVFNEASPEEVSTLIKNRINIQAGKIVDNDFYGFDEFKDKIITTPEGRLNQKVLKQNGIKDLIKKIGCPDLAAGGRVGFETGANCYSKGVEKINLGKIGKGAEAINFAKLFTKAYTLGRGIVKYGIIPEAFFIAGESSLRVGMGDKIGEAFGKATSFLPGGTARENAATKAKLERILGNENASIVLGARNYQKAKDELDNVIKSRDAAIQYADEGKAISGLGGQGVGTIKAIKDKYKRYIDEAEKKVKLLTISGAEEDKAKELEDTFTDISGTKNIFSQFVRGNRGTEVEPDASGLNYDLSFPEINQEDLNKRAYSIAQQYPRELMILSDDEIKEIFSGESGGDSKAKDMIAYKNKIKEASLADYGEQLQGFNIPEIVSRKNQYDYVPADYGTYASGGIASLTRTIPPERGPNSQGLASLKEYDKQY